MPRLVTRRGAALGLALLACGPAGAADIVPAPAPRPLDPVSFGLDWLAEAEYGGYYQALAKGYYTQEGLDVHIQQGGPQVNQAALLLNGTLNFTIASNSFLALNFARENLPFVVVAAMFQKDPSILLAHPGMGNDSFAALVGEPIMIGADTRIGWWKFLERKYGYTDNQIRPYTDSLVPFLVDRNAIQQGYLGSEPFLIKQQGHFDPVVLPIAESGFAGYGSLIATSTKLIAANPSLVQRFLVATEAGWKSYLEDDPTPGNALIKQANPDMTDALLDYGRTALKDHGIVESGDAAVFGIGAMTAARWEKFFQSMVDAGVYQEDMSYLRAFTLQFQKPKLP